MAEQLIPEKMKDWTTFNCSVCSTICHYDFPLPCRHTLCFHCLKKNQQNCHIFCPLCELWFQGDAQTDSPSLRPLPVVELEQQNNLDCGGYKTPDNFPNLKCCMTCSSYGQPGCMKCSLENNYRPPTDRYSAALNKEAFLTSLKEELLDMKKKKLLKLEETIQKRNEIQNYITQVLQALNSFGQELLAEEESNTRILSSLVAQFNADQEQQDECIQPYLSMLNNMLVDSASNSDSKIHSLAQQLKMHYANELHDDKLEEDLNEAAAKFVDIDKEKKAQIKVTIYDESGIQQRAFISKNPFRQQPLPEGSNEDELNPFRRDALLLTHAAYSIKKRKDILDEQHSKMMMQQSQVHLALDLGYNNQPSSQEEGQQKPEQSVVLSNPKMAFILGQSHFYLPLWKRGSGRTLGEIRIRSSPESSSYADFIQKLGDATFKSPAYLYSMTIGKIVPAVFALVSFVENHLFQPVIPDFPSDSFPLLLPEPNENDLAGMMGDVGVTLIITDSHSRVTGWSLLFPLENFLHTGNKLTDCYKNLSLPPAFRLGRISNASGMDCIRRMMAIANNEKEDWSFSITSQ